MKYASESGKISLEEYLRGEEDSEIRHEYVDGVLRTMSGTSTPHNQIVQNLIVAFRGVTRKRNCRIYFESVMVQIGSDRVYYPDLILACSWATIGQYVVTNPSLVVEVTSPSTRAIDRREKLEAYMRIPALDTYLIVEQSRKQVVAHRRDGDSWRTEEFAFPSTIVLPQLDASLTLDEIYEDVDLPPLTVGEYESEWGEDSELDP